ncbi:MAG: hypothetical protein BTN85_1479 [Candidatus Methanohalarchaeum thermophilum]|uniref:Uncharacterized protein n=1 Tax=Methanohalarchaeum thermophilum TaxID=1903181 RepID=A0A1Q6DX77_METT1|nr:MAG: hypothetical protein BTN85_1479 [Candidatus Methanohalarchaeum thermophilum]
MEGGFQSQRGLLPATVKSSQSRAKSIQKALFGEVPLGSSKEL